MIVLWLADPARCMWSPPVVTTRRRTARSGSTRRTCCAGPTRQAGKVKTQTLGDLSPLPAAAIEAVWAVLRGEALTPLGSSPERAVECVRSHVAAVWTAARSLGQLAAPYRYA